MNPGYYVLAQPDKVSALKLFGKRLLTRYEHKKCHCVDWSCSTILLTAGDVITLVFGLCTSFRMSLFIDLLHVYWEHAVPADLIWRQLYEEVKTNLYLSKEQLSVLSIFNFYLYYLKWVKNQYNQYKYRTIENSIGLHKITSLSKPVFLLTLSDQPFICVCSLLYIFCTVNFSKETCWLLKYCYFLDLAVNELIKTLQELSITMS